MSAKDHLQGEQLRMFIPAHELMGFLAGHTEINNDDYLPLSESPGVYREKLAESKTGSAASTAFSNKKGKDSLYESIKKEGVQSPVTLRTFKRKWTQPIGETVTQINDGHHRIAAAHDIDPNMEIPVTYK